MSASRKHLIKIISFFFLFLSPSSAFIHLAHKTRSIRSQSVLALSLVVCASFWHQTPTKSAIKQSNRINFIRITNCIMMNGRKCSRTTSPSPSGECVYLFNVFGKNWWAESDHESHRGRGDAGRFSRCKTKSVSHYVINHWVLPRRAF